MTYLISRKDGDDILIHAIDSKTKEVLETQRVRWVD